MRRSRQEPPGSSESGRRTGIRLSPFNWATVIVPAAVLIAFDYVRHFVLPISFMHGWSGLLMVWGLALAGVVAFSLGVSAITAKSEQEIRRRNRELEATAATATVLGQSLELEELLNVALEKVLEIMDVHAGTVCVLDEAAKELVHVAHRGIPLDVLGPLNRAKLAESPVGAEIVETGKPVVLNDLWADPRLAEKVRRAGFRSAVSVPLRAEGKVVGVLALVSNEERCFSPSEVAVLTSVGSQLGVAVRKAILFEDLVRRNIENAALQQQVRDLAVLEERERIAREMHDGVGQILGYVNTTTQAARKLLSLGQLDQAEEALGKLEEAARDVYADVREAIVGLRTTTSPGFLATLEEYLKWFSRQNLIQTELTVGHDWDGGVETRVEIQLIRIVQEALSNVRKHARAQKASISISTTDDHICLVVDDNGQGFHPERIARGAWPQFGLQTMRERAEAIGGTFDVTSIAGEGTTVRISAPRRTNHR
ncbi:MAG: GAF domain-containing sensor histidine kinase [Chloroflexi bacterium]|nr:GAF domain-containing sensor histidine kinase [Chloroflexota bacterium]